MRRAFVTVAIRCAWDAECEGELKQAGRIWKQAADLSRRCGDIVAARFEWGKAHALFERAGAQDQLLKLGPEP